MTYRSEAGTDPRLFPPVLDVPGVADLLGLSIEETRRLIGEGWIDCARVKGRLLFHRDRVDPDDWYRVAPEPARGPLPDDW